MTKSKGRKRRSTTRGRTSRRAKDGVAGAALAKAKPGRAALADASTAGAQDELRFTISWAEKDQPATLAELRYNDAKVTEDPVNEPGKVSVSFKRPISAVHAFAWDLLFAKRKLHTLDARAAMGTDELTSLKKAKDATDDWSEEGEL